MRGSPSGGKWYKRKGIFHQASLPGFPPRIDRGGLVGRMITEKGYGYAELIENTLYAKYLEFGTKKMEARPHLEPAIERSNWQGQLVNRLIAERFAGRSVAP